MSCRLNQYPEWKAAVSDHEYRCCHSGVRVWGLPCRHANQQSPCQPDIQAVVPATAPLLGFGASQYAIAAPAPTPRLGVLHIAVPAGGHGAGYNACPALDLEAGQTAVPVGSHKTSHNAGPAPDLGGRQNVGSATSLGAGQHAGPATSHHARQDSDPAPSPIGRQNAGPVTDPIAKQDAGSFMSLIARPNAGPANIPATAPLPAPSEICVLRDRTGARLDLALPTVPALLLQQTKSKRFCNNYHLLGRCRNMSCAHRHGPALSIAERDALIVIARQTACRNGHGCAVEGCIFGHGCTFVKDAKKVGMGKDCVLGDKCWFSVRMHDWNRVVVEEEEQDEGSDEGGGLWWDGMMWRLLRAQLEAGLEIDFEDMVAVMHEIAEIKGTLIGG